MNKSISSKATHNNSGPNPKKYEARLRTILQSEPECVKTVNAAGQLVALNPAGLKMMGVTDIEQVRGTHLSMLIAPQDWNQYQEHMAAVFKGETKHWQFRCNSPTGEQRWMEQTAGPVRSPEDPQVISEMIAITRDITERKLAEGQMLTAKQEAEKSSAAKTNFLANMSHEIRTPMNGILGMASMLAETELTEDQEQWVTIIKQSGESLIHILNDILDLSKVEADRIELERIPLCLRDQIQKLQQLQVAKAKQKRLSLKFVGCEHVDIQRTGDPMRLVQILNNILDNAIKFTTAGAITAHFTCGSCLEESKGPEHVQIRIQDTGIGMTPDQMERVFEPFAQAETTTTRRYGGTGLGLTIAKSLTELMDGTITMESRVRAGTTFEINLLLPPTVDKTQLDHETTHQSKEEVESDEPTVRTRILAVEDGEVNRIVLSHILNKLNAEVVMVHDGEAAIEAFNQGNFDLILMDIHMPVMDGITALKEIRRIEQKRGSEQTPVAAVTASVTNEEVNDYIKFGFSHCIAKPTEPDVIRELVESIRS
jgi:PAS domain S-box-containing protein